MTKQTKSSSVKILQSSKRQEGLAVLARCSLHTLILDISTNHQPSRSPKRVRRTAMNKLKRVHEEVKRCRQGSAFVEHRFRDFNSAPEKAKDRRPDRSPDAGNPYRVGAGSGEINQATVPLLARNRHFKYSFTPGPPLLRSRHSSAHRFDISSQRDVWPFGKISR